jgi:FkbM family methyltransferase
MGRFLYYRGTYEEGVLKKLRALLRPGNTFVDVGANVGLYAVIASHLVGPQGRVIAIEPQESLQALLLDNLRMNGASNATPVRAALGRMGGSGTLFQVSSDNDGQATLRLSSEETSVAPPENVPIETLDAVLSELGIEHVDGVKIDVEGAELEVLEGFRASLARDRPRFVFFECIERHLHRFQANTQQLLDFFVANDYRVLCLSRGRWHPLRSASEHRHLRYSADMLALPA